MSRVDGRILEYIPLPGKFIDLSCRDAEKGFFGQVGYARIRKSPEGIFLYNPESDTIFLYNKDKALLPFLHKKPLISDSLPMTVMDICMEAGPYQFLSVYPYEVGEFPSPKYYMREKTTGEIFRQKITLPDYAGKELFFDPRLPNYYENAYHFELDYIELQEAYQAHKLSGPLKELAATLDPEEDNNIFILVNFH